MSPLFSLTSLAPHPVHPLPSSQRPPQILMGCPGPVEASVAAEPHFMPKPQPHFLGAFAHVSGYTPRSPWSSLQAPSCNTPDRHQHKLLPETDSVLQAPLAAVGNTGCCRQHWLGDSGSLFVLGFNLVLGLRQSAEGSCSHHCLRPVLPSSSRPPTSHLGNDFSCGLQSPGAQRLCQGPSLRPLDCLPACDIYFYDIHSCCLITHLLFPKKSNFGPGR